MGKSTSFQREAERQSHFQRFLRKFLLTQQDFSLISENLILILIYNAIEQFHRNFDLAVSQTSQNPVYYVQYAHARICSIFRGLEAEGVAFGGFTPDMAEYLTAPEERELIKFIAALPNTVNESAKAYDPARMTRYVVEIATMFHKFYSQCRVKGESEQIMQARLGLCMAVKQVIKNILDMLKIECPEQM